jgi:hypothetical protein
MTNEDSAPRAEEEMDETIDRASDPIATALRGALAYAPSPQKSLLPKIQQRIRITTRGRYYRDRWSTARDPVPFLLMIALLILILAAAVFLVLQPLVEAPEKTHLPTPAKDPLTAPVQDAEP